MLDDLFERAGELGRIAGLLDGARLEHARALVELGAAMRRADQRAAAREPMRARLGLVYRCGAAQLGQWAATEPQHQGQKKPAGTGPAGRPAPALSGAGAGRCHISLG